MSEMTLEQSILETVKSLPADKQQELLDHARRLQAESRPETAYRSVKGLWTDLGISLSGADIDEVRREMWKNFPRDDA